MGWKTVVHQDDRYFSQMKDLDLKWGDVSIVSLNVDDVDVVTAGVVSGAQTDYVKSFTYPVPPLTSLIKIKYGFYASKGSSGRVVVGVQFLRGGSVVRDVDGRDVFGVTEHVINSPIDMIEMHVLNVQHVTGSVTWWVDDIKVQSRPVKSVLSVLPDSYKVVMRVDDVSGGEVGVLVVEHVTQQYDVVEDVYLILVPLMSVMTVVKLMSLFRVMR